MTTMRVEQSNWREIARSGACGVSGPLSLAQANRHCCFLEHTPSSGPYAHAENPTFNERPTLLQQGLFSFFYLVALTISTMAQAQYETVLDEMVLTVEQESHTTYLRH